MRHISSLLLTGVALGALVVSPLAQDALPQADDSYFKASLEELARLEATVPNTGKAKNIILFVGDGMSIPTLAAARIYEGQAAGGDGETNQMAWETLLPYSALSKTYTHDSQVADSAPTATAMVSGVKSLNGTIGVNQNVTLEDCSTLAGNEVKTIFESAEEAGLATGVVTTTRITHATPAATYAHTVGRDWEADSNLPEGASACKDIAAQLIDWTYGNGFEVMFGGGRTYFMPETATDPEYADVKGRRKDGRDLIAEWQQQHNGGAFVWNAETFNAIDTATTSQVLGLFEPSHMQYEADRKTGAGDEPSLAEMTTKAIELLQKNEDGFVLMVEAGRIDHGHHDGNAARALEDMVALSNAVKAAYAAVNPEETLIVLTADHSHTMTFAGYPVRGNPILGIAGEGEDGLPYTTLGYANGPGAVAGEPRGDLTGVDTTALDYRQQALVPMGSETHSGEDVGIFAQGPWAHLFHGVVEQNTIYQVMAKAIGLSSKTM